MIAGFRSPRCSNHPVEGETEDCESRQVDRARSRVDVGGDALQSTGAGSSSAPGPNYKVSDLSFDHRTIGPVASPPRGVALFGPGPLQ